MTANFTADQKQYLEGFATGLALAKATKAKSAPGASEPQGPDAPHIAAQNRVIEAGGKLADQEKWKREEHPFDAYGRLKDQAARNEFPKPADNFRWRYYGLFYVAPNQNAYMCRLRIPNGILKHWQFAGMADIAEQYGGGYAHVTTRANLQIREIDAKNAVAVLEAIQDLGLCSRGSGADNIRNVTGTATAGIDPHELIDTRPYAREWHFHILNERALYGLPRKFNVAFDGAGRIPTLEDTNDIGFQAVGIRQHRPSPRKRRRPRFPSDRRGGCSPTRIPTTTNRAPFSPLRGGGPQQERYANAVLHPCGMECLVTDGKALKTPAKRQKRLQHRLTPDFRLSR